MKVIPLFKNETQLISRSIKNNREAQRLLFEKYSGKMLSVCRMYIQDLHHAEEVMLTGFFKVFKHLGDFKNEGSFEGWIRRIMIRESISYLRVQKQMEFRDEIIIERENFSNVQADIDAEHIQQLIDNLPEGYRAVFIMYAIEGYKHQEIAEMLNITTGTSKSQLFKARKTLQEKLELQNMKGYGTK